MPRVVIPVLVAVLLLAACDLVKPTHPAAVLQQAIQHPVAPEARAIARDTRCDDQPDTYHEALAALTVPIRETKLTRGALTAAPLVLLVPRGWHERGEGEKLIHLREELAHYCQRRTVPGFDQLWLTGYVDRPCRVQDGKCVGILAPRSDFRAALEVAAKRAAGIRPDPAHLTARYLLHDLEPKSLAEMIQEAIP